MQKPLPVEVEVVSARRWAKLERSLFARWDEEQRRGRETESQSARPRAAHPMGRMVAISAAVFLALAASLVCFISWRRASEPVALEHTSRIVTGVNGSHLSLQGLTLDVEPESAVVLGSPSEHGMLIVLDRGGVVCEVAPRAPGAPLVVQAGSVQVKVVGTRFSVTRTGEKARVAVEHGIVEVAEGGRVARVGAGQIWPFEAPPVASAPAPASAAPSAVEDGPVSDGDSDLKSPAKPVAKRGSGQVARAPAHGEAVQARSEAAQARFEAAAALERSEPARAVELYRSLENGSDSWAQHALYAHGRLEAARGNAVPARQLLERYLVRFPKGPNRADARSVLERLR